MTFEQLKTSRPFDDQDYLVVEYPDFFFPTKNKKVKVKYLGEKFAVINSFFYEYLKKYYIPCAFLKRSKKNSLVYLKFLELPFKVKILNSMDKRTAKMFSGKEGNPLNLPVFEYHYGSGKDSLVSESHLIAFDLCTNDDLKIINRICSKVNAILRAFFERRNEIVAEVICSFGKYENKIFLVDDFTPLSLKVFPNSDNKKWSNPYKLTTSNEMKKYTDYLFNITNS